jgi:hypothetical protein
MDESTKNDHPNQKRGVCDKKDSEEGAKMEENNISSIEIFIQGEGFTEIEVINLPPGSHVRDIAVAVGHKKGVAPEELLIFEEDGDDPLDFKRPLNKEPSCAVHHAHRVPKIDVVVQYLNKSKEKAFSPSTRIQKVLDWVVGRDGFAIDPTIAPEMELALRGETKELPKEAHIGRYVQHPHHRLELDLIRGIIPNG